MGWKLSPLAAAIAIGLVSFVAGLAAEHFLFGEVSGWGASGAGGYAAITTYIKKTRGSGPGSKPA